MSEQPTPETPILGEGESAWGLGLRPLGCARCGQAHLAGPDRERQTCPNCARGRLAPQPALLRLEPPELLAPFRQSRDDLRSILADFVKPVWLRPDDLEPETMLGRAVPVYLPMWLVDCDVSGDWQAEAGFDYQVKSSQESYGVGGWQTRELTETRIRWEPRVGQLQRHYANVAVPALSDQARLLALAGEYRTEEAGPFDPARLDGAAVRVPDLPPESAWPAARAQVERAAAEDCRLAARAQHVRNFAVRADYRSLHWTQLLLPLYVTYYADDTGQAHPIYINGQSGRIGGVRRASQRKGWVWAGGMGLGALALLILGLLIMAAGVVVPPVAVLGVVLAVLAFAVGALALVPAIWPWHWNRGQPP